MDTTLVLTLIPVVVPLLVYLTKRVVPKMPRWTLPILATGLGVALDVANGYVTGGKVDPVVGALLGASGVGVREVIDQVKSRIKNGPER